MPELKDALYHSKYYSTWNGVYNENLNDDYYEY